jgi:TolA-binding protein
MGKIGIVYMGNIDGSENNTPSVRTEQEGLYFYANHRRSRDSRHQSKSIRNQSQRTNRAHSPDSLNVSVGKTHPGGTVSQLIRDYRDQVASKQSLIQQTQDEINYLQSRIEQFEELVENLEESTEETA